MELARDEVPYGTCGWWEMADVGVRSIVLWVPDWPIVAAVYERLVDPTAPAAIYDARGVCAVSAVARAQGVRVGMRRRRAQRVCPEIVLVGADEARDIRAFDPVMYAMEDVVASPSVLRPGLAMGQAHGAARYAGSEETLAEALVGVVARESGAEASAGIAHGFLTAVLAARMGVIVPAEATGRFLAPHPATSLRHAMLTRAARAEVDEILPVFTQLGVRTLGDVAALPRGDVVARFGSAGETMHVLSRGGSLRVRAMPPQGSDVRVGRELDPPAERSDTAAFAARSAAEELAARLQGRACARLTVRVSTEDGAELSRVWAIEGPLSAADATDRVRWQLDGWLSGRSGVRPSAPLSSLELHAEEVDGAAARAEHLWGRTRSEDSAGRAVLRLSGMYGAQVYRPVVQGGRDPRSRALLVAWNDDPAPRRRADAPWPGGVPAPFPSTVLDSPAHVHLLDAEGRSVTVDVTGQISAAPGHLDIRAALPGVVPGLREIRAWAGPWPVSERWWDEERRGAWMQVVLDSGPALLLALRGGAAAVEGIYD